VGARSQNPWMFRQTGTRIALPITRADWQDTLPPPVLVFGVGPQGGRHEQSGRKTFTGLGQTPPGGIRLPRRIRHTSRALLCAPLVWRRKAGHTTDEQLRLHQRAHLLNRVEGAPRPGSGKATRVSKPRSGVGAHTYGMLANRHLDDGHQNKRYSQNLTVNPDDPFSYHEDTELWNPVKQGIFDHTDDNTLTKVE